MSKTNRDLLKEAIADAKSVKETAIANAKAALEEAFTPHLKDMLSAKLQEMDDEEELEEADAPDFARKNGKSIDAAPRKVGQTTVQEEEEVDEEMDLEELLAELNSDEEVDESQEAEEVSEVEDDEEAEESEEEDDVEGEEDEEIDLEDMSEDDLKGFIADVINDMVEAGELEAGDDFDSEEEEDEDFDIEGDEGEEVEMMEGDEEEDLDEYGSQRMQEPSDAAASGMDTVHTALKNLIKKGGPIAKKAIDLMKDIEVGSMSNAMKNEEEEEFNEIEELRKELNEVNLLNAKLLYANKLFANKNLTTESKKVGVLKAFDKVTSVKEAKLVYETLNEGITSGTSNKVKNTIKGSASKSTSFSPNTTKQPIVESNEMVTRFQKLAGIITDN